jgi:hypothetical protein
MRGELPIAGGLPLVGSLLPNGVPWGASAAVSVTAMLLVAGPRVLDRILSYKLGRLALTKVSYGASLAEVAPVLWAASGQLPSDGLCPSDARQVPPECPYEPEQGRFGGSG